MSDITTIPLKNGSILGCMAWEITAVPWAESLDQDSAQAQAHHRLLFQSLISDLYRYSAPGRAVYEFLWLSQPDVHQPSLAKIRLFALLRMTAASPAELKKRLQGAGNTLEAYLKSGKFAFEPCSFGQLQASGLLPGPQSSVNAVVKAEQCTVHARSILPYYYAPFLPSQQFPSFDMLTASLVQMPNCAVSFQLLPTAYSAQEASAITEMEAALAHIAGGFQLAPGQFYWDPLAQSALEAYRRYASSIHQPLFSYHLLAFGSPQQCAALSARIAALLQQGNKLDLRTINLDAERMDLPHQLAFYPWHLNRQLITRYRNPALWQKLGLPEPLLRLPYLVGPDEAASFFAFPLGTRTLAGIPCQDIVYNLQHLNEGSVQPANLLFGQPVGGGTAAPMLGCPPKTLTKHMLIVGKPGTGKTTFSVHLLIQLAHKGIPFLAVEPTKTEYRALIDAVPGLQVFTPGNNRVSPFMINPFIPPRGITVEQFIPSLASAFKAAFSMPSPLDALFQAAIQESYVQYGWKDYSTAQDPDVNPFGLHEFILVFKKLIQCQTYSAEIKGNLQSAGILRLQNLIEQNPNIYDTTKTIPIEDLLSRPTVLELNAIDNQEQKAVLMALLLINICVYTKHNHRGDGQLKNVLLVDEAHVLFQTAEPSDGAGSAVRSLENMLAEIRSYGTAVIIADQSPAAVGPEVVKNTEVKVVFQLVDAADCQMMASAMSMRPVQSRRIPQLAVGQAFIGYGLLPEPVLVQTPDIRAQENIRLQVDDREICARMNYWDAHSASLIPFRECSFSAVCSSCDLKLRSDAAFYASRFLQIYGGKMTTLKAVISYIGAVDRWLSSVLPPETSPAQRTRMENCVKIRLLRKLMQQKDIPLSSQSYDQLLQKLLGPDRES